MIGTNEALKERLTSFGKNLSTYLANLRKYTDYIRDTDNIVFMRIEEVVLMKAEALFRLGRDAEALAALKQIANARVL